MDDDENGDDNLIDDAGADNAMDANKEANPIGLAAGLPCTQDIREKESAKSLQRRKRF